MRFVSQHSRFIKTAIKPETIIVQTSRGPTENQTGGVICEWKGGGLTNHEIEEALARFDMRGLAHGRTRQARLSVYDTDVEAAEQGWDSATKREVEEFLVANQDVAYFLCEPVKLAAPWPGYDKIIVTGRRQIEHVVTQIREMVEKGGYDPAAVVEYERQTLARPEVVEALEALSVEPEEELVVA